MDLPSQKSELRKAINERLARYPQHKREAESRSICRRILEILPPLPLVLAAYYPLTDEVDIRSVLEELLRRGVELYLPRFDHQNLTFRRVRDLHSLLPGELRIPEPPLEADPLHEETLDVVLVPGRAFDQDGNRIGRGNGGYDKWISAHRHVHPRTRFYGIALECQMLPEIPVEEHDQRVDGVITARGLRRMEN